MKVPKNTIILSIVPFNERFFLDVCGILLKVNINKMNAEFYKK